MKALLDTPTTSEPKQTLPWRLNRDYPTPWPSSLVALENSTESEPQPNLDYGELSFEASKGIAEAILRGGLPELCRIYVELLRQIPEVQQILLRAEGDSTYILTVIDAPPFERQIRYCVYEAQQTVLETVVSPPVEFRLINLRELQDDPSKIVPLDATTLYTKK